jgi:hypothetical protein
MSEVYTKRDAATAPDGHMRIEGTAIEVFAYRSGDALTLGVNIGPLCLYRATLVNAAKPDAKFTPASAIVSDTFVIREFPEAKRHG